MKGTMADFARHIGVHKSSVKRAVDAGRLIKDPDGQLDFDTNLARWHSSAGGRADVAARHAAQRGAAIPKAQPTPENPPAAEFSQTPASLGIDDSGRAKAKQATLHYENSSIKLEMALRRGLRFEKTAARRESTGLGALLRAGIERVIDQTAPRGAATGNDLERRRLFAQQIRHLRWVFKRELPRALRRMKEQGARVDADGTAKGGNA